MQPMTLNIFKGKENFEHVGTVTIQYDRIIHVNIKFSEPDYSIPPIEWKIESNNRIQPTKEYFLNKDTQYHFLIKKNSKADFPYRNAKLTHEIISNELLKYFDTKFFIKLSFFQRQIIAFNLKKFFWQTEDFKSHIYKYIATNVLTAILSVLGTLSVVKTCNKKDTTNTQSQPSLSSDTLIHQTIHKTTKSLNDVSYKIDTTKK